jgi:hypothetical protein
MDFAGFGFDPDPDPLDLLVPPCLTLGLELVGSSFGIVVAINMIGE